jgi:hypothetical protein
MRFYWKKTVYSGNKFLVKWLHPRNQGIVPFRLFGTHHDKSYSWSRHANWKLGQEVAAVKAFKEFLESAGLGSESLDRVHSAISEGSILPTQNFYSLLTAFSIFLTDQEKWQGSRC